MSSWLFNDTKPSSLFFLRLHRPPRCCSPLADSLSALSATQFSTWPLLLTPLPPLCIWQPVCVFLSLFSSVKPAVIRSNDYLTWYCERNSCRSLFTLVWPALDCQTGGARRITNCRNCSKCLSEFYIFFPVNLKLKQMLKPLSAWCNSDVSSFLGQLFYFWTNG